MKKKRSKLQWLACLLVAAVLMTVGTPATVAYAMDDNAAGETPSTEVDLIDEGEGGQYGNRSALGIVAGTNSKGSLNFTSKTVLHMEETSRYVPVQILQEAINVGTPMPDPQGTSAVMYTTPMYKNGKLYDLEVLYNADTNEIYHFMYTR